MRKENVLRVGDIMEMVSFKVENGESEKITQDAYAHGMNKSEYLRWLIDKQRKEDEKNG